MRTGIIFVVGALAACAGQNTAPSQPFGTYLGADTRLLADDLVNFQVKMRGQFGADALTDYADCVAAQYSLNRGFTHARLVRTNVYEEGGVQIADAIYTLSSSKPQGTTIIEATSQVATCEDKGIPTV